MAGDDTALHGTTKPIECQEHLTGRQGVLVHPCLVPVYHSQSQFAQVIPASHFSQAGQSECGGTVSRRGSGVLTVDGTAQ